MTIEDKYKKVKKIDLYYPFKNLQTSSNEDFSITFIDTPGPNSTVGSGQKHKDQTSSIIRDIADMVLYDPPYSARQVSESYKRLGESVNMQTTQSSYWARQKKEIARITKKGGVVITCAWNSGGIGAGLGFEQQEILLVAHGGWHNDTIVTVERKMKL